MSNNSGASNSGISNHILPTAATMTGVCITVISIVRLIDANRHVNALINNLIAFTGLIFLISCFLSYISIRSSKLAAKFERYADFLFLAGLLLMVIGGFLLAWEFEHF